LVLGACNAINGPVVRSCTPRRSPGLQACFDQGGVRPVCGRLVKVNLARRRVRLPPIPKASISCAPGILAFKARQLACALAAEALSALAPMPAAISRVGSQRAHEAFFYIDFEAVWSPGRAHFSYLPCGSFCSKKFQPLFIGCLLGIQYVSRRACEVGRLARRWSLSSAPARTSAQSRHEGRRQIRPMISFGLSVHGSNCPL